MRIILYTGKGGVGKTSIAAVRFATRGEIRISRTGDQLLSQGGLLLQIGGFRHRQILPRTLVGLSPSEAKLDEADHLFTARFERAS